MKSTGLKEVGLSKDGRTVVLRFRTQDGRVISFEMPHTVFATVMLDMTGLSARLHELHNPTMPGVVSAAEPKRISADRTEQGEAVVLSFEMPNGLVHRIALPTVDATKFGKRISSEAEKGISPKPSH